MNYLNNRGGALDGTGGYDRDLVVSEPFLEAGHIRAVGGLVKVEGED